MKWKNLIRATSFLLIFAIAFTYVSKILTRSFNNVEYHWMSSVYEEPKNSLDAVYLGSSNCFAFWNQNVAWGEYGIAVKPYTCSSQPLIAAEYLIKEARKTQPDAVYIVNVNTLSKKVSSDVMHLLLDFMPLSMNKLKMTDYLCDIGGVSGADRLEYYLPIVKFHTNWSTLNSDVFSDEMREIKDGNTYPWYLERTRDISSNIKKADGTCELHENITNALDSLLDYCDEEDVKILFVAVPRAEKNKLAVKQINTVNNLITERGYTVLDLREKEAETGIYAETDFYNDTHTNIHGAIKHTHYISQYLIDNYGFENKQNNAEYSSWNEAYNKYYDILKPYVLDIELDYRHRDYSLAAPGAIKATEEKEQVTVNWKGTQNAEGYAVYRKSEGADWERIGETEDVYFNDTKAKKGVAYIYTVVPFAEKDGEKFYGSFAYKGAASRSIK